MQTKIQNISFKKLASTQPLHFVNVPKLFLKISELKVTHPGIKETPFEAYFHCLDKGVSDHLKVNWEKKKI